MEIYWHRNGNAYIRYSRKERPPNGAIVSMKTIVGYPVRTEKEAQEIFKALSEEWHRRKLIELDRTNRITLEDFRKKFTSHPERSDLSPKTLRMDDLALRSLGDVIGHKTAIKAISDGNLARFKKVSLARGLSPHSLKSYFRHVKAAMNFAVVLGYRDTVPRFPKVKAPKRLPKVIPRDALQKILAHARKTDFEVWRIAGFSLYTGCRLSGCHGLKWQQVKLYGEPKGKMYGWATVIEKGDKERNVPLVKEATVAMGTPRDIGPVFLQCHPDNISHRFSASVRACGYTRKARDKDGKARQAPMYSFHGLRHTAATWMLERGYRLNIVQKILGHVDIRTTQIYAEVFDKAIEDEINRGG